MGRIVLVTGVASRLAGDLVRRLNDEPAVDRVIGIDVVPPRADLGRAEFVRADIRNPIIAKVIGAAEVDTVVHMSVSPTAPGGGGRTSMKELNVIGTMQLLAACQKAPSLRRLIVKSTTSVYGASARDPALFTETMEPKVPPRSGFAKDATEVESYVRGFVRRRADVDVTVLRFADLVGPDVDSPITALFSLPAIPTILGHDARLQFLHSADALEVLRRATVDDQRGIFNVAGPGMLLLSQAARRAGRPTLPLATPLARGFGRLLRRAGVSDVSAELIHLLAYGRGVDVSRLREAFGFTPAYSTGAAFEDFLAARGRGLLTSGLLAGVENRIAGTARMLVGQARRPWTGLTVPAAARGGAGYAGGCPRGPEVRRG